VYRGKRRLRTRAAGFAAFPATSRLAAFLAAGCLAWALPASAQASPLPTIESESVSHVAQEGATLEAKIDPDQPSPPYVGVYYQFQVVKNTSEYLAEILCPSEPPGSDGCGLVPFHPVPGTMPIGFIQGGPAGRSVSQSLAVAGIVLQPAMTYHYRVLAARKVLTEDTIEWQAPFVEGPDQTFTTPPPPSTPSPPGGTGSGGSNGGGQPAGGGGTTAGSSSPGISLLATPAALTPGPKVAKTLKPTAPTTAQKLARALKACKRKPKAKRAACARQAHKRYGRKGSKTGKR
jgi:hypothetical protein